jgi:hypothetical protein
MARRQRIEVARPINTAISNWASRGFIIVHGKVKDKLSGEVLKIDTGHLIGSVDQVSRILKGGFVVGTNVVYGVAWEKGFTRNMFMLLPRKKKALAWGGTRGGKQKFFSKGHMIPFQRFPAKPFLRPSIEESEDRLLQILREEVSREFVRANPKIDIDIQML